MDLGFIYFLAQYDHIMFMINGVNRLFYPEISPLIVDHKPPLALLGCGFKVQKLPKGCLDGKSDPFLEQVINHIRKVIMNLVPNASEAIESSGNITISTGNRYVDRPISKYEKVNVGEYAVLSQSLGYWITKPLTLERIGIAVKKELAN
jgi:signal transduction histidine kinase